MTTKQIIENKINDLERKIRVDRDYMDDALEQIQNGVNNIDYCKKLIEQYDFSKERISKFENDLKLLKLAIKAIEENK